MLFQGILFFGSVVLISAKIPDYIKVCKSNEQDLAQCITNSVNSLRTQLMKGIPELDVPPMDPLFLDEIQLRSGPNSAKLDANITNIKVWGPSQFRILELKPNVAKKKFAFKINIPNIRFEGNYDIDMNILLLKYKGQGPINGNFTDYSFDCVMKGHLIKIDGKDYLKFDKVHLNLNIGKSMIRLENLFRDDPIISKATDEVISDNTEIFLKEIQPTLEKGLADKFTDIANKLTLKFTYQELFP